MNTAAWRLTLVAVTVAGALAGPGAGRADAAACQGGSGVTVVVDFGSLGGGVVVRCAPGDPASGLAALQAAGFSYSFVPRFPGLVCQIDAKPNSCNGAPNEAYWAYFHAPAGGSWDYSEEGAGTYDPAAGTVEGWSFDDEPGLRSPPSPAPVPPTTAPPATPPVPAPTAPPAAPPGGQTTSPPADDSEPDGQTGATATTTADPAVPGETSTTATTATSSTTTTTHTTGDRGSGGGEDEEAAAALVAVGDQSSGGGLAATAAGIGVVGAVAAGGAIVARRRRLADLDGLAEP